GGGEGLRGSYSPPSGLSCSCLFAILCLSFIMCENLGVFELNTFSEPPSFVKKMEPKITWKQGIAARLQCTVKGSPELHIHWFWNERELSDGDKHKISFKNGVATVEIMSLVVTDSGSYTCEVSNNAGSESCSTLIAVKGLSTLGFALH
uniref:Ig-like domain-containing protein n=1 Tax=Stegastes partitus TaxID=144197 RepID=A0A3B5BAW9_9TELE